MRKIFVNTFTGKNTCKGVEFFGMKLYKNCTSVQSKLKGFRNETRLKKELIYRYKYVQSFSWLPPRVASRQ